MAQAVAFPWPGAVRVRRSQLQFRTAVRSRLRSALRGEQLAATLAALTGEQVSVSVGPWGEVLLGGAPEGYCLCFERGGLWLSVQPEPDLARICVARVLREEFQVGDPETSCAPAVRGAAAALALDAARRVARSEAPRLNLEPPDLSGPALACDLTVSLRERPFRLRVLAGLLDSNESTGQLFHDSRAELLQLGELRIELPWVQSVSWALAGELHGLAPGDVWLPGNEGSGEQAESAGWLAPAGVERGWPVRMLEQGLVLGSRTQVLPDVEPSQVRERQRAAALESNMSEREQELQHLVAETPVCVRMEVGVVEMSAAEWANLRPGDVVESGRRVGEEVVLRAGTRVLARGQLVEVEGQLGVRITALGT